MHITTPLSRELSLDEIECREPIRPAIGNQRGWSFDAALVLALAGSVAIMGLAVVGGIDVLHRFVPGL